MNKRESIDALIKDLQIDIECAKRDGLSEYAEDCQKELDKLINTNIDDIKFDRYGYPIL